MTTSGTTTFLVTRDDIISSALRTCGVLAEGQAANATQLSDCAFALNILLKNYASKGWLLWVYTSTTVPLGIGTQSYTIGPTGATITANRPVRIAQAFRRDTNGYDTPLNLLTRQEYDRLTPKTQQGLVNSVYYDAQLGSVTAIGYGVLYVWPTMSSTGQSIILTSQSQIQDITSGTQHFQVPQEWFLPLKWQLASEVGPEYGVTERQQQRIDGKAEFYLNQVVDFAVAEEPSVYFTPSAQGR